MQCQRYKAIRMEFRASITFIRFSLVRPAHGKAIWNERRRWGSRMFASRPFSLPNSDIFLVDDYERTNPAIADGEDADATARNIAALCRETGLQLLLDVVLDRVAASGAMARSAPHWFYRNAGPDIVDPRQTQLSPDALPARFDQPERAQELTAWWTDRLVRLADAGVAGFRLLGIGDVPPPFLKAVMDGVRQERGSRLFAGWTPGVSWSLFPGLEQAGLDAVFGSTSWWDGRASWFIEEHNALRRIAPQIIGLAEAPFEERLAARSASTQPEALRATYVRSLRIAAATGQGLLVPMGFEFGTRRRMDQRRATADDFEHDRQNARFDLADEIRAANKLAARLSAETAGEMRSLSGPGAAVTTLLQVNTADVRTADRGIVVAINVERPQAEFASWYELFPALADRRSGRHGTFDDVIARLPRDPRDGLRRPLFPADPSDRHAPTARAATTALTRRPGRSRQPLRDRRR
jgi:hypothetical protein